MWKIVLVATLSAAAILTSAAHPALAQQQGGVPIPQPDQPLPGRSSPSDTTAQAPTPEGMMGGGMMGRRGMMDRGLGGLMERGRTGAQPFMMRIMFALIDTDGDGAISLQEFQAAHERLFKAMDSNKDGRLSPQEMQNFIHGPQGPLEAR